MLPYVHHRLIFCFCLWRHCGSLIRILPPQDATKRRPKMCAPNEENAMVDGSAGSKAAPIRKLKKEQGAPAPSTQQAVGQRNPQLKIGDPNVRAPLEKGISELQNLHK